MMQRHTGTRWGGAFAWGAALRRWLEQPGRRSEPFPRGFDTGRSRRGPQAVRIRRDDNERLAASVPENDARPYVDVTEATPRPDSEGPRGTDTQLPNPIASIRYLRPSAESDPSDWEVSSATYRRRWQQGRGRTGGDWADVEPGYRYGFERAMDGHLRGRSWKQVEAELCTGFADWSRRHGYDARWTTWENVRAHVSDVWDELAGPLAVARLRSRAS